MIIHKCVEDIEVQPKLEIFSIKQNVQIEIERRLQYSGVWIRQT